MFLWVQGKARKTGLAALLVKAHHRNKNARVGLPRRTLWGGIDGAYKPLEQLCFHGRLMNNGIDHFCRCWWILCAGDSCHEPAAAVLLLQRLAQQTPDVGESLVCR